jgi:hypothetical protein
LRLRYNHRLIFLFDKSYCVITGNVTTSPLSTSQNFIPRNNTVWKVNKTAMHGKTLHLPRWEVTVLGHCCRLFSGWLFHAVIGGLVVGKGRKKGFQICQTSPPGETNPGASHRRTLEPPPCFGAACLWDLGVRVILVIF